MTNACTCNRCRYAGFWRRVLAHVVDAIAILVFLYAFVMVAAVIVILVSFWLAPSSTETISSLGRTVDEAAELTVYLLFIAFWMLYRAAFESSPLQATIGKLAVSIKVTDVTGQRISFLRALARNPASLISDATFLIGYLMVAFTPRKRALHDMVAGCLVVKHDDVPACSGRGSHHIGPQAAGVT